MRAHRATLVQMFEVAFSRRMCCSRVWSVRTIAALAVAVHGGAHEAPGHAAHELRTAAKTPRFGPPIAERHAEPLALAHHDVGAEGARRREEARGSPGPPTTTRSAPLAWAISPAARTSSRQPRKFGYWTTTAAVRSVTARRRMSRSVTPSARATRLSRRSGPSQYVSTTWRYSGFTPRLKAVSFRPVTAWAMSTASASEEAPS